MRRIFFFALSIAFSGTVTAQIKWPAVTTTMKPWTRWWWEGSAVDKAGLTWNLEEYQKAGLGGVEITPIYGIYGYENRHIEFLSPQWMQMLMHTLNESKRLGLGVDLANATGWPFGGPWVKEEDASKAVYYKTYTVKQGEQLNQPVEYYWEAWIRTANNKSVKIDTLSRPVYANMNLQALALDQIQYPGKLPLKKLMAYYNGRVLDLTKQVDATGKLKWTAPEGNWTLYALFENLHGKMVERAAPGGEGYAIDHFSASAARNYFKRFDEAFKGYDLSYLRGFFNDSYEVDDARGQANWTPDFLNEFRKRKGYNLEEQLPALFGKSSADSNSRVIYDYRSVIDELILDNFTKEWKKWGASKGKILRNQSHGSPANTLDLYSVVDIPETEGTDVLRFKFATSAANVTGKKLVSSESATWLNEHFLSSWSDVKKAIDLYFIGGVNHIFYHGTAYSPEDVPWPGWLFYAAVHFQPTNPQWKDFHALNSYITRVQSFLQQGKPANDVLLYYPLADRYSEPGNALLQHFDGMERNFENTDFEHVSKWMLENGYSFDFFSDRQLQQFKVINGMVSTGGNTYKTILLPGNKLIPPASLKKLKSLAEKGITVLFYKRTPNDAPGLAVSRTDWLNHYPLDAKLKFTVTGGRKTAKVGKGKFSISENLDTLLAGTAAEKETMTGQGLQFIKRKLDDQRVLYFISNTSGKPLLDWVPLKLKAASVALLNPMTGEAGLADQIKPGSPHTTEVLLHLQPGESVLVQCNKTIIKGPVYPYADDAGPAVNITGNWSLEFINGGPVLPEKQTAVPLGSWTDLVGEAVKNFSGTAKYRTAFPRPVYGTGHFRLDLGKVYETAEVFVNGKRIATLVGPSFQCIIPASVLQDNNTLELVVTNLMANRIIYMDKNNLPWKIFYNTNMPARKRENVKNGLFSAADWSPLPSGLMGPVTLTPVRIAE